ASNNRASASWRTIGLTVFTTDNKAVAKRLRPLARMHRELQHMEMVDHFCEGAPCRTSAPSRRKNSSAPSIRSSSESRRCIARGRCINKYLIEYSPSHAVVHSDPVYNWRLALEHKFSHVERNSSNCRAV